MHSDNAARALRSCFSVVLSILVTLWCLPAAARFSGVQPQRCLHDEHVVPMLSVRCCALCSRLNAAVENHPLDLIAVGIFSKQ